MDIDLRVTNLPLPINEKVALELHLNKSRGQACLTRYQSKMVKRYEIVFSGLVQGVGFRFSARNLATKHKIKGWVLNLSDGGVKLLAEGSREDLDNFLHDLRDEFKRYIVDYIFQEKEASGNYEDFQIKFPSS